MILFPVDNPITIEVKGVGVDSNAVYGKFDNGADATSTNLLVYLHDYKADNC